MTFLRVASGEHAYTFLPGELLGHTVHVRSASADTARGRLINGPQREEHVLMSRTWECSLVWKMDLCRCG